MSNKHFILTAVKPKTDLHLFLTYADGESFNVDVAPILKRIRALYPIRDVFMSAKLGEFGHSVIWNDNDDLELAADNLRARAIEQAGEFSHETILNWMARHSMTLDAGAAALGLSRRMLAYYRSGEKPVPRTVGLACIGWEHQQEDAVAA